MFQILSSAAVAVMAAGAMAASAGHGVETVRTHDLDLSRPVDVARLERRLEAAALAACGAYDGSVRLMKQATARSACYRETLAEAKAAMAGRAMAAR